MSLLSRWLGAKILDDVYNPVMRLDSSNFDWLQVFVLFLGGNAMGHSRAEKTRTHERIVTLASKRFREKGLTGVGIAELMDEAGLTVGGFYKHFASRDDLVAEAMRSASGDWKRKLNAAASGGAPITFEFLVDDYLSEAHRDDPGAGCPVSALSADVARSDKLTRALVTAGAKENIELLASTIREAGEENKAARSRAMMTYCALVGAIALARAVSDEQLSREILKTVARLLKSPAPKVASRHHGR